MTEQPKKFKVYHTKSWALNSLLHFATEDYNPLKDDYELVATVHCLDVEQAFYFTNHIDKSWFDHLNVDVVKEARSTSVGDVVVDEDGKVWLCAGCGWEEKEWSEKLKSNDKWWISNGQRYQDYFDSINA